jgi:hypothetical protein
MVLRYCSDCDITGIIETIGGNITTNNLQTFALTKIFPVLPVPPKVRLSEYAGLRRE